MLKYDFTRRHETWLPDIYLGRSHRSPNILTRYNSPWRFYLEFVCDVRCHLVTIDNWKPEGGANIMAEYNCNRIEIPALNILFYAMECFSRTSSSRFLAQCKFTFRSEFHPQCRMFWNNLEHQKPKTLLKTSHVLTTQFSMVVQIHRVTRLNSNPFESNREA